MVYSFGLILWCYCLLLLTKCDGLLFWPDLWCYCLLLLTTCDVFVFWSDFVMLLFVVAHKVWWFSVLTWFYDVIVCCRSQSVMVLCFDVILWCYCLFVIAGLVFWPCFVIKLFGVANKVWWFSLTTAESRAKIWYQYYAFKSPWWLRLLSVLRRWFCCSWLFVWCYPYCGSL